MTDLEKTKYIMHCLGLETTEIHTKETEIEIAVYDYDIYLGSIYFNLDGSLITWDD